MEASKIEEYLHKLGAKKVRASSGNVKTNCVLAPWTHERGTDRKPSLSIRINDDGPSTYYCWACGAKGPSFSALVHDFRSYGGKVSPDLYAEVVEIEAVTSERVRARYTEVFGTLPFKDKKRNEVDVEVCSEDELVACRGKLHKYILDRGVSKDICKQFEVGYDEDKNVLVFPVRRRDGSLVGAMARSVLPDAYLKHSTYFPFNKSNYLYGEHLLKHRDEATFAEGMDLNLPFDSAVILVEGQLDVYKLRSMHYENTCGLMTARLSDAQADTLVELERPVLMMLDWDLPGYEGRVSCCSKLIGRTPVFDVPTPYSCIECGNRFPRAVRDSIKPVLVCSGCGRLWKNCVKDLSKKDPDAFSDSVLLDCIANAKRMSYVSR